MHARRVPLVLTVTDGVHRLVLLAGVFFFALAMAATALQGPGPRTIDVTYPSASHPQPEPLPALGAPVR